MGRNSLIPEDTNVIPYWSKLNAIIGNVTATIMMTQMEYWFQRYPEGFYKFRSKPENHHPLYKDGDSWTEELSITVSQYKTAFRKIGVVLPERADWDLSMGETAFQGMLYASHFFPRDGTLYFFRNHQLANRFVNSVLEYEWIDVSMKLWKSLDKFDIFLDYLDILAKEMPGHAMAKSGHVSVQNEPSGLLKLRSLLYPESTTEITPDNSTIWLASKKGSNNINLEKKKEEYSSRRTNKYNVQVQQKKKIDSREDRTRTDTLFDWSVGLTKGLAKNTISTDEFSIEVSNAASQGKCIKDWGEIIQFFLKIDKLKYKMYLINGKMGYDLDAEKVISQLIDCEVHLFCYCDWYNIESDKRSREGENWSFTWNRFKALIQQFDQVQQTYPHIPANLIGLEGIRIQNDLNYSNINKRDTEAVLEFLRKKYPHVIKV